MLLARLFAFAFFSMADTQQKNSPAYQCAAYNLMARNWQIVNDVRQGTLRLRDTGSRYLPIEPAEDTSDYSIRRSRAIFFNAYERALSGLVGMVFRKEPKLGADVPEAIRGREDQGKIEGLVENIDLAGTHWTVFAKEVFTDAVNEGHSFIYVDMPPALPDGATLADERAAERRPYWVKYEANQAINWRVDSRGRLTQITFKECSYEPSGEYGEEEVIRYRVLKPGEWSLYREVTTDRGQTTIIEEQRGVTSLSEIPVAVIYSRKTGNLTSKPPLLDLALINLAHFQKYSDYSIYLHICSRPVLWFRGRDKSKKVEAIGPYTFFDVADDNGAVGFAETSGSALGAARQDLIDLQEQMAILGLSLLAKKTPNKTATAETLDHVKEESDLATAARSLKDGLEQALRFTAQYLDPRAATGGSVELGATIEEMTLSSQEIQAYSGMVASNQLSLETLWQMLSRAGRLPESFDTEQERQKIEQAIAEQTARSVTLGAAALADFDRGNVSI